MHKVRGIIPALDTPTNEKGELDPEESRSLVEKNIEWGSHAVAVSIVAGEFYKFSDAERKKCFDIVVEATAGQSSSLGWNQPHGNRTISPVRAVCERCWSRWCNRDATARSKDHDGGPESNTLLQFLKR